MKNIKSRAIRCQLSGILLGLLLLFGSCLFLQTVSFAQPLHERIQLTAAEQQWLEAHRGQTITVAFDSDFAPYSFRDEEQGAFQGIAVDFIRELAYAFDLKLRFYPDGLWKNLYSAAQKRDVDIIATLVQRPGREEWFSFTQPYLHITFFIITRKDYDGIRSKDQMSGKTMALVKDYSSSNDTLKAYPHIKPYYVDNLSEAMQAVATGKAEGMFTGLGMGQHLMEKLKLDNLKFATFYYKGPSNQCVGVRNDWPELAGIFDKVLAAMSQEKKMQIFLRWTKPLVAEKEIRKD